MVSVKRFRVGAFAAFIHIHAAAAARYINWQCAVFSMKPSHSYVLVLDQHADDLQLLESLLKLLKYSMVAADSVEQAIARVSQEPPCLVILVGNCYSWCPLYG